MAGGANSLMGRAFLQQSGMLGNPGVPSYVPPSALSKGPAGTSNITPMPTMSNDLLRSVAPQTPQAPQQLSPLVQQMMQRAQPQMSGLPAALMQMQGQLNQPMMRNPMPTYRSPALDYKPNMAPAMEALNRVQPSVYKTELDAARERLAQYEAAEQSRQQDTGYNYG